MGLTQVGENLFYCKYCKVCVGKTFEFKHVCNTVHPENLDEMHIDNQPLSHDYFKYTVYMRSYSVILGQTLKCRICGGMFCNSLYDMKLHSISNKHRNSLEEIMCINRIIRNRYGLYDCKLCKQQELYLEKRYDGTYYTDIISYAES